MEEINAIHGREWQCLWSGGYQRAVPWCPIFIEHDKVIQNSIAKKLQSVHLFVYDSSIRAMLNVDTLQWTKLCSPKRCIETLILSIEESDNWKMGLCRCHNIKMKSLWWALIWWLVPYEKKELWAQTQRESGQMKVEAEMEGSFHKLRMPRAPDLGETKKAPQLEPSEGAWPCQHLDFRLPATRTIRQ